MSLKTKLENLVNYQNYTFLEDIYRVAQQDNRKQSNAERQMRKIVEEQEHIEPHKNPKGHIVGYFNRTKKQSQEFNQEKKLEHTTFKDLKAKMKPNYFNY